MVKVGLAPLQAAVQARERLLALLAQLVCLSHSRVRDEPFLALGQAQEWLRARVSVLVALVQEAELAGLDHQAWINTSAGNGSYSWRGKVRIVLDRKNERVYNIQYFQVYTNVLLFCHHFSFNLIQSVL